MHYDEEMPVTRTKDIFVPVTEAKIPMQITSGLFLVLIQCIKKAENSIPVWVALYFKYLS